MKNREIPISQERLMQMRLGGGKFTLEEVEKLVCEVAKSRLEIKKLQAELEECRNELSKR